MIIRLKGKKTDTKKPKELMKLGKNPNKVK